MKKKLTMLLASLFLMLETVWAQAPVATPEAAITGLLNRIGGNGAAEKFEIVIDDNLAENGKDVFVITSQNSKPCIKGNTQLSVATGINWYLNHHAHINLTWNNLTTDLSQVTLPVPTSEEKHVCNAPYRYDFNTCTFSYSMAFWTWERWQQEIDWMALHGINAPLNLVGLDVVTRKFLRELGVSENDINAYIAGPGFIAWFAMNNLEGWGGTINATDVTMNGNPDWWYTRQENLCRNMLQRMRELGMQPVIPGFSGQVPNCIVNYSINGFSSGDVVNNGTWAGGYTRPDILKPNTESYRTFAAVYYKHLHEVMGVSELYSIDPFHEGSLPSGVSNETCYPNIMVELDNYYNGVSQEDKTKNNVDEQPKWIIQYWQGVPQSGAFSAMSSYGDRFIGLDLFSDAPGKAQWNTNYFNGRPYIFCMLHNFGGRSGMHGRLESTMNDYFRALAKGNNCKGIGATPEGTETNPVLYDMLFELPWMDVNNRPTADEWLEDYAYSRYGVQNNKALAALKNLKKSVWACPTDQQGTSEAVILARPNWTIGSVSSWSTAAIYWDTQDVLLAADELSSISDLITTADGTANYNYDFIDVVRQSMVDYAAQLLPLINAAHNSGDNAEYTHLYQLYLQLMLDLDAMLSYDENFKLERWTSLARNIANEVEGTTENDRRWLEWNARTQVTVWSKGDTDLHDYSNRCWAGLIKDFHYKRWEKFFTTKGGSFDGGWFNGFEYPWTVDFTNYNYSTVTIPNDMTATEKAAETFGNYFGRVVGKGKNYLFPMGVTRDATKSDAVAEVSRGQVVELPLKVGKDVTITSVWVDLNNDGAASNAENLDVTDGNKVAIAADAAIGKTTAKVTYDDGTVITFGLALVEEITEDRTVTAVAGANGAVAIEGADGLTVTNKEAVKMTATANTGYNFKDWTDAAGNVVSNDNPYIYYGKEDATFTANFIQDKWGVVACNGTFSGDIASYKQFIHNLNFAYYNREAETIFETTNAPTEIFNTIPKIVNVPQGASFTVSYNNGSADGLKYCYFRAYIDLNQDGDFDDEGELLKETGTNGATNTAVCSGSMNVLLPYDMPLGITHMRLRFDGAWDNGNKPSGRGAKDASIRPVYELILNVTEFSDKAATINVETNNDAWGTVKVWTNETPADITATEWNVTKGVEFNIAATKASDDVEFLGWYDQYGRLLTENLEHTMYAREDATYTARFRRFLDINGWSFEYRTNTDGNVILTRVEQSGDHDLVIPETVKILDKQCKIVGFDNDLFNGNKDLWTITLPKNIRYLSEKSLFNHSLTGNGNTQVFDVDIKNNEAWRITMDVERTGELTGWGSCLIASGDRPAKGDNENYAEGFQFYLQCTANGAARDKLIIKTKTQTLDKWYFDDVYQEKKFTVVIEYNGAQQLSVNVLKADGTNATNHEGKQEPIVFTDCTIQDIKQLCTNVQSTIKADVLISKSAEANPFSGCSNLGKIVVDEDCANYYVNGNGDLYNASEVLVCVPEGKGREDAIRALGTLIDNTKALMDVIATSVNSTGKATEIALNTTQGADYYIWCNNPHTSGNDGKGGVAALLDEDAGSYLHSNWSSLSTTHDYLQIDNIVNPEGLYDLYNFKIAGQQRGDGQNDRPKNIEIYGSNDKTNWTPITTVEGLPNKAGATWSSNTISPNGKYSSLKFVVKTYDNYNQTSSVSRPYFHMAKFDLIKLTSTIEVAVEYQELGGITNDEAANVYDHLVNALYVYNNGGTAEELQAAYDALERLYSVVNDKKNKVEYVREINELAVAVDELMDVITTSISPVTELMLTTTQGQDFYVSTNADQNTGGGSNDGGGIAALVDNNESTYFHTRWGGTEVKEPHYIQVDLGANNLMDDFMFNYKPRNGSPAPTAMTIYGSNDGTNFTDVLATINSGLPAHNSGKTYNSAPIDSKRYRYLRFTVTGSAGPGNAQYGGQYFFGMLEFDLIENASDAEVAPAYGNLEITNEEAEAVYDNMLYAQSFCNSGTAAQLKTALDALKDSYETLNAKISPFIPSDEDRQRGADLLALTGVGYPSASSEARIALQEAVENPATILPYLNEAIAAFKASTDITLPDNGKAYQFAFVANDENLTKYNIIANNTDLSVSSEETATTFYCVKFTNVDGQERYAFISPEGNFLGYHALTSEYRTHVGDDKRLQNDFVIAPMVDVTSNVNVGTEEKRFGTISMKVTNRILESTDKDGYFILKFSESELPFDKSSAPFYDGKYTSAIKVTEVANYEANNEIQVAASTITPLTKGYIRVGEGIGEYAYTYGENTGNTFSDFEDLVNTATSAIADADYSFTINMPAAGFYRIKSMNGNDAGKKGKYLNVSNGAYTLNNEEAVASIMYIDEENKITNYASGLFVNTYKAPAEVGEEAVGWNFTENAKVVGSYTLEYNTGDQLAYYLSDWTGNVTYGQDDANAAWIFEEVVSLPVAVSSAGYATFIAPVALEIPANVKAHTGVVTGNYLVLTEVTGTIPANTGVVLEAAENTYNFNIVADVDRITSHLVGSTAAKANDKKNEEEIPYYTLQKPGDEVVFMQYNGDVLAGSKAYLDFTANPTSAKSISIRFEGTTDIEFSTLNPQPSTQIYDLMGRRVEAITKGGIYIVNGKKVIR